MIGIYAIFFCYTGQAFFPIPECFSNGYAFTTHQNLSVLTLGGFASNVNVADT
jgi:hypothetical protein